MRIYPTSRANKPVCISLLSGWVAKISLETLATKWNNMATSTLRPDL